jgi:protease-4
MSAPKSTLGKFLSGLARLYSGFRSVILNLLFLFLLMVFVASLIGQSPIYVQPGSALLLNPGGTLVDQLTYVDPLDTLMADSLGAELSDEVLLQDVLDAIYTATADNRISSLVLVPGQLLPSGFSKLQDIGDALLRFRESGKKVYAYGDYYTQGQYYLAAHADEVILNGMGSLDLEGFSSYQMYFRDALDNLGVNIHIFRVGEYKSAVEPFERNNMSPEAREANINWLGDLWQQYLAGISDSRNLKPEFIESFINNLDTELAAFNGDMSALVLARGFIDTLMDRDRLNSYLQDEIGIAGNGEDFLKIDYRSYLAAIRNESGDLESDNDKIGIIVASGNIYDGSRGAGEIGGDSLQDLVRRAREDDDIKALVLRIDSGGGSAFASEIIRNELASLAVASKPLVVSMGSVAASGGYWIATPAAEIWASNSTITGSIGIFGLYPTFEDTFAKLGISTDGVGTTALAGALMPGRPLPELAKNVLQLNLEDGYNRFITLVAESRNMSVEEVEAIARGRVWSGEDALAIGLVDHLGRLEDAVAAAARLAGLADYGTRLVEMPLTPGQQFLQNLANNILVRSLIQALPSTHELTSASGILGNFTRTLQTNLQSWSQFNDPRGLYLHCQECQAVLSP